MQENEELHNRKSEINHSLQHYQQETVTLDEEVTEIKRIQVDTAQEQSEANSEIELIQGFFEEEKALSKEQ